MYILIRAGEEDEEINSMYNDSSELWVFTQHKV